MFLNWTVYFNILPYILTLHYAPFSKNSGDGYIKREKRGLNSPDGQSNQFRNQSEFDKRHLNETRQCGRNVRFSVQCSQLLRKAVQEDGPDERKKDWRIKTNDLGPRTNPVVGDPERTKYRVITASCTTFIFRIKRFI